MISGKLFKLTMELDESDNLKIIAVRVPTVVLGRHHLSGSEIYQYSSGSACSCETKSRRSSEVVP